MKKLLASASFVVLGAASAMAADMPMKAAPYMAPVPVFNWTGCYVGVHGGGGAMRDDFSDSSNGTGAIAGGQVGCNYQDGNWVFGVEGEGWWSGIKGTNSFSEGISNSEGFAERDFSTTKNKYDFAISGRAGITFDRTLIYGKAGWVWGKFNFSEGETGGCCNTETLPIETATGNATLNGLLLGLGIEHALTQNWTVKLEYNYLRYGSKEVSFSGCSNFGGETSSLSCGPAFTASERADKQLFKFGANYLFNVGGPVVAKY